MDVPSTDLPAVEGHLDKLREGADPYAFAWCPVGGDGRPLLLLHPKRISSITLMPLYTGDQAGDVVTGKVAWVDDRFQFSGEGVAESRFPDALREELPALIEALEGAVVEGAEDPPAEESEAGPAEEPVEEPPARPAVEPAPDTRRSAEPARAPSRASSSAVAAPPEAEAPRAAPTASIGPTRPADFAALQAAVTALLADRQVRTFLYCPRGPDGHPLLRVEATALSVTEVWRLARACGADEIVTGRAGVDTSGLCPVFEVGEGPGARLEQDLTAHFARGVPALATAWLGELPMDGATLAALPVGERLRRHPRLTAAYEAIDRADADLAAGAAADAPVVDGYVRARAVAAVARERRYHRLPDDVVALVPALIEVGRAWQGARAKAATAAEEAVRARKALEAMATALRGRDADLDALLREAEAQGVPLTRAAPAARGIPPAGAAAEIDAVRRAGEGVKKLKLSARSKPASEFYAAPSAARLTGLGQPAVEATKAALTALADTLSQVHSWREAGVTPGSTLEANFDALCALAVVLADGVVAAATGAPPEVADG